MMYYAILIIYLIFCTSLHNSEEIEVSARSSTSAAPTFFIRVVPTQHHKHIGFKNAFTFFFLIFGMNF